MNFNTYQACVPVIASTNVTETVEFYVNQLGFIHESSDDHFAIIWADECQVFIMHNPDQAKTASGQRIVFAFPAIDELYEKHKAKSVVVVQELQDQEWGMKDYIIQDPSGYHLWFTSHIETHYKPWLESLHRKGDEA